MQMPGAPYANAHLTQLLLAAQMMQPLLCLPTAATPQALPVIAPTISVPPAELQDLAQPAACCDSHPNFQAHHLLWGCSVAVLAASSADRTCNFPAVCICDKFSLIMLLHLPAHAGAEDEGHFRLSVMHCHENIMQNLQKEQAVVLYQCEVQQQGELKQGHWHAGDACAQGSQDCQGAPPHQCLKDQQLWHFI